MKNIDSYFIAYILEGMSGNSGLLWDHTPLNGKTTNLFEDLVHFCHQYFHSNTVLITIKVP